MGLIKAGVSAVSGVIQDQWKEYIKCEDLGQDILLKKVTTKNGVISKSSAIQVSPGQIAVIFQSGKVLDATAEEGIYTFDESSSPSFFAGDFKDVFKEMWSRFTFGGAVNKEQAVFYINAKEIMNNKFGTKLPVVYQDWSHPVPNQMTGSITPLSVNVRCFGTYTFKISDPAAFMSRVAGTSELYTKEALCEEMKTEVMSSFQNVLNALGNSENKVPVLELPGNSDKIKELMDEKVFDKAIRERGLQIVGFYIESVTPDEASQTKIDNYELSSNAYMQAGTLTGAYANAVQDAAKNANGSMTGFMGMGMMNMASGNAFGTAVGNTQNLDTSRSTTNVDPYASSAKFCSNCGQKVAGGKFCSNCGSELK